MILAAGALEALAGLGVLLVAVGLVMTGVSVWEE